MKAKINDIKFHKEYESQHGTMFVHAIFYDEKKGFYTSKKKEQTYFVIGQEAEFTEEKKSFTGKDGGQGSFLVVKPVTQNRQSNFGKALNKEKSRYSGFAVSYAKDLVCHDRLKIDELPIYAWVLFDLMVDMDRTLET
jgi:hypothetical protein